MQIKVCKICRHHVPSRRSAKRSAQKLSNLLQPDRLEEDLQYQQSPTAAERATVPPSRSTPTDPPPPTLAQLQNLRQEAKAAFARLRNEFGRTPST